MFITLIRVDEQCNQRLIKDVMFTCILLPLKTLHYNGGRKVTAQEGKLQEDDNTPHTSTVRTPFRTHYGTITAHCL